MAAELSDRTVFITGASRGLGRALAQAFADAGSNLVLCARGEDDMARVADTLRDDTQVEWGAVDVADEADVAALVARATERFGPIDALVNNASILGPRVPLREHPIDEWRQVLDVNLTGTLIPILAVLPGMREAGRGSIINVSSGVGNIARERWGAYAISKWGVEALSKNLALEEEEAGIRVNIVDPGRLRTEMRREAYPEEDPKKPSPPEDATDVFLWLASPESKGVTGERFRALEWSRP
ncbi:MAG: SDR family NAD(P)-dependent oxidoreductase [Candidatus Longimicrobiales bacterium M2_2A_002]